MEPAVIFPNTLDVRLHYYKQGVVWETLAPFYAIYGPHTEHQRIKRVPSGRFIDFASVPRQPVIYLVYANIFHVPACCHDNDYAIGGTEEDRRRSDDDFLMGMLAIVELRRLLDPDSDEAALETEEKAYAMYHAVRQFASRPFNHHEGVIQ